MVDQNGTTAKQIGVLESTNDEQIKHSSALRYWLPYAFTCDEITCARVHLVMKKEYEMRNILIERAIDAAHLMTKDEMNVNTNAYGRAILREITRASCHFTKLVKSSFLHQSTQLYPKDYLIDELERNLKVLLLEDIRRKESLHPILLASIDDENDTFIDTYDSDNLTDAVIEESEQVDDLFCTVCRTNPCNKVDTGFLQSFRMERETVTNAIMDLRKERVKLSKQDPEDCRLKIINQEILSLQNEASALDVKIKLENVDKELHDILKSNQTGYFVIRSLHQYDCLMEKDAAISALKKEHDRLVAYQSAKEILDDTLCRMEEGWSFGEINQQKKNNHLVDKYVTQTPQSQHDLIACIHRQSHMVLNAKQSLKRQQNLTSFLDSIEKSIRIGLVCWLIRYFRAMVAIECQKKNPPQQLLSSQRLDMIREEKMAKERETRRIEAYEKARIGSIIMNKKNQTRVELIVSSRFITTFYTRFISNMFIHIYSNDRLKIKFATKRRLY
jgi:hypothetical protein